MLDSMRRKYSLIYLYKIEKGKTPPSLNFIFDFCELFKEEKPLDIFKMVIEEKIEKNCLTFKTIFFKEREKYGSNKI
jgi:DNA-binding XRE family transcriptional regulator